MNDLHLQALWGEGWQFGRKCYSLPNHYDRCTISDSRQWLPLLPHSTRGDVCLLQPAVSLKKRIQTDVSHEIFHQRLKSVKQWFEEFSDVQRNRLLSDVLPMCNARQLHLLSTWLCGDGRVTVESVNIPRPATKDNQITADESKKSKPASKESCVASNDAAELELDPSKSLSTNSDASESSLDTSPSDAESSDGSSTDTISPQSIGLPGTCRLHLGCPPNCQDPFSVLPIQVSFIILSYLDPQMLARAAQVSRVWRWISNSPVLWHRLALLPSWRLSPRDHVAQLAKHTNGSVINWKEVVVERWRVRRNWLGAHCHVRTFSGHSQGVTCVQFDQNRIVSASHDNTIKVWSMRTNSQWPVQTLVGHSGRVRCLQLSDSRLVSGAADATIKVWEVEETSEWSSIVCRVTMTGHTDTVRCLQVCGDDTVVSGSYDHSVRVWSLPSGVCKRTLLGHTGAVLALAVVQPLKLIVSGGGDNAIKIWDLETGSCLRTLRGHTDAVTSVCADEHGIVSGSLDSTIRAWDVTTGACRCTVNWISSEGHTGVVRCVAADEWRVVSASDDKTIKVWERHTLRRLVTLRNHTDGVTCLSFNEFFIVSGSYDKTVKLWDFSAC